MKLPAVLVATLMSFNSAVDAEPEPFNEYPRFEAFLTMGQLKAPDATFGARGGANDDSSFAVGTDFRFRFADDWFLSVGAKRARGFRIQDPGPLCPGEGPCPIQPETLVAQVENMSFGVAYQVLDVPRFSMLLELRRLRSDTHVEEYKERRFDGIKLAILPRYHFTKNIVIGAEWSHTDIEQADAPRQYTRKYLGLGAGFLF